MAFTFNNNNQQSTNNQPQAQPTGQPQRFPQIQYNGAVSEQDFIAALENISRRTGMQIQPQMITQQLYNQICPQYQQAQQNPNALSELQQQVQQLQQNIPLFKK